MVSLVQNQDIVMPVYAQPPEIKTIYQDLRAGASATDREGIAFLILTGKYLGFLPEHYASRWIKEHKMRALCPAHFNHTTPFTDITSKSTPGNLVLETFLELIDKEIQSQTA
ncbi:hypothetical protein M3P05_04980 [Sansalvadorimonas sp. 2012CJ34-2]|uniref:Uncharacterized protein n=1 Tax=Parendozoicomonas callyspongiae TaxID=2942213 RepID=A0ABT0PD38_9GAMM|nr:hypothetical protein [Sansalvadorimonas sp. 2012CJ34-2]MCL6269297.1 hypothetical protein [Sansalvadorimonas sp. 2012CJ34-2]